MRQETGICRMNEPAGSPSQCFNRAWWPWCEEQGHTKERGQEAWWSDSSGETDLILKDCQVKN